MKSSNLSKISHLYKPQPSHELKLLGLHSVSEINEHSKNCTLSGDEQLVSNETLNLPGEVPNAEKISAR